MTVIVQKVAPVVKRTATDQGLAGALLVFRREFFYVAIFSVVLNLLMLSPTIYMLQIFDRVLSSQNLTTLAVVSIVTLFMFLIMAFSEWARSVTLVNTSVRIDRALSERVFKASFLSYLLPDNPARSKAFGDLTVLRQFMTGNGVFVFFDLPWIFIFLGVLFLLHPLLGIWALGFAVVQLLIAWFGQRISKPAQLKVEQSQYESMGYLQSKLRNVEMLGAMGMLGSLFKRWQSKQFNTFVLSRKAQEISGSVGGVSKFMRYAQQTMSLAVGAWLVIHGEISPGAMIAANVLMGRALAPIDMLSNLWPQILACRQSYDRLSGLLGQTIVERTKTVSQSPTGPWLSQDLTVRVAGREMPLLSNVTFSIAPATITIVMGPSGSGKSTLARAMLGIWPGHEGNVRIDGHDINAFTRESLGPHIGYLPQDIELFDGTIAENIARIATVDSAKVIEAAQSADLHQMILGLPQGYDTPVGRGGEFLSGGQRQRIGLARALYGSPKLIVLDEPNANLDEDGEAALLLALIAMRQRGCMVLVITHRGGIIEQADQLLMLREGRVAALGTPQQLAAAMRQAPAAASKPQS